jgi:hypothetical protein
VSAIVVLLVVDLWKDRRFCPAVADRSSAAGAGSYTTIWNATASASASDDETAIFERVPRGLVAVSVL